MDAASVINKLVAQLIAVQGIRAIALGGSRATGSHTDQSDIDIGLYYDPDAPIDVAALERLAAEVDDTRRSGLITPIGEWGPWINGGGWLQVDGFAVDLLYRDLGKVTRVVDDCLRGHVTIDYQPGHPHGFVNATYMAEAAQCIALWDPARAVAKLKSLTQPYPSALKDALLRKFMWEAGFSLAAARKAVAKKDVSYAAGCCFRSVSCLNQALFALNGSYWMNEKGAVRLADGFPLTVPDYSLRVTDIFSRLSADPEELQSALAALEAVIRETERLAGASGAI